MGEEGGRAGTSFLSLWSVSQEAESACKEKKAPQGTPV